MVIDRLKRNQNFLSNGYLNHSAMSRLTSEFNPCLTKDVLDKLSERRLVTVVKFAEAKPELIAKVTDLQYRQVIRVKDLIIKRHASKPNTGLHLYRRLRLKGAIFPSGIKNLDTLLEGGFMTGKVYELCGPASCGKSQICMALAAGVCSSSNKPVVYIDTKGDFIAARLASFIKSENVGSVMQKIKVIPVRNPFQLLNSLHDLARDKDNACIIIIDSLAALFYQYTGEAQEGINFLSNVSSVLFYLADEKHTAVVITNVSANWQIAEKEEPRKAALGKFWAHVPETRISMEHKECDDVTLKITKSASLPIGGTTILRIGEQDIT